MYFLKKNRFKPLFKQIIKLRGNIQNRKKLLNFKKKKWKNPIQFYKRKIRVYKNHQKFKPLDQTKYYITRYSTRGTEYKKRFRDKLNARRSLRLLYGGLTDKLLKNKIKNLSKNKKIELELKLLKSFETRLDSVLYRAKFCTSLRSAGQLIAHGKVYINQHKVTSKSYQVKPGDLISLNTQCLKLYEISIVRSLKWPLPPKHLLINYRTMQILFIDNIQQTTLSTLFLFHLKMQKILTNYL